MNLKRMLFIVLLVFSSAIAQQHSAVGDTSIVNESTLKGAGIQPEEQIRKLYWTGSLGLFECFNFGFGYQINQRFAISLKYGTTWLSDGGNFIVPGDGNGIEYQACYFVDLWLFNYLSFIYLPYCETSGLYDDGWSFNQKGKYIEFNVGNQNILNSKKSNWSFFWSIGLGISTPRKMSTLILPTFNLGYQYSY